MRIVVTGATGFLGKYVVRRLEEEGCELTLMGTSLERLRQIYSDESLRKIETDYISADLECQTQGQQYDAVVHLAAKRLDSNGLLADFADNIRITENILRWCDTCGIGRIIMASSQSVYRNGINMPPFHEEDAYARGIGKAYGYAYSKYICEQLAYHYQTPMISLRFGQLLGWGEKKGFMFSTQLDKVQHGEPIVLWGNGGGGRDYLYCKDAVEAILAAIVLSEAKTEAYNVSMGCPISFREFAETLVDVFGNAESKIIYDHTKQEDTSVRFMSLDKATEVLGWQPRYNLRSAFVDMQKESNI